MKQPSTGGSFCPAPGFEIAIDPDSVSQIGFPGMRNIDRFADSAWGILLGASRKSWIDNLCDAPVDKRIGGSLAAAVHAVARGVEIIRTHDVFETVQAIETAQALTDTAKT